MEEANYNKITDTKIKLLKYGIKFEPVDLFNKFYNIDKYKTKDKDFRLTNKDFTVYNSSDNIIKIPSEILLSDEKRKSITKLRYNSNSPISINIKNNDIWLEYDNKKIDIKVELVEKNPILFEKIPTDVLANNSTIGDYVSLIGIDRVAILFFEGCYNWLIGKPCKFCNLPQADEVGRFKPNLNYLKGYGFDVKKWWDFYKKDYLIGLKYSLKRILEQNNLNHMHIFFMSGNLPTNTDMWDIAEEVISYLANEVDFCQYDSCLNISPHDKLDRLYDLKKTGIRQIQYNLELINTESFADICPGKMRFEEFLNKLKEAVQIYGRGNVRSNFVLGLNDIDATIKFAKEIAYDGIVFDYTVFQPKRNTPLCNKNAPDFDNIMYFSEELANIYVENDFKPIFCSLSSRSCIINELYEDKIGQVRRNK